MNLQRPNLELPFKPRVLIVAGVAVLLVVILIAWAVWPSSAPKADPPPALPQTQRILCSGDGQWACRRFRVPGPDHLWREFEGPAWLAASFPLTDARWST